jgi:hypothetical protein
VILLVAAAEALTVPFTDWRENQLTKRFVAFFDELMPDDLDRIVLHDNAEQALGLRRGQRSSRRLRRDLLGNLYSFRSGPLHEGLAVGGRDLFGFVSENTNARRLLANEFVVGAVLRYLQSPRTSLIGQPR